MLKGDLSGTLNHPFFFEEECPLLCSRLLFATDRRLCVVYATKQAQNSLRALDYRFAWASAVEGLVLGRGAFAGLEGSICRKDH